MNQSEYWNLRTKLGINQNVEIWVLIINSIKMLIFEWKVGNQSKSWRFSAIRWELIKMLKFEWKMSKSIKILKFEYNKSGTNQNVEIWAKKGRLIKCWHFIAKWESIKMLEFDWKIRNRSGYWNWEQNWESIKMLKFEC